MCVFFRAVCFFWCVYKNPKLTLPFTLTLRSPPCAVVATRPSLRSDERTAPGTTWYSRTSFSLSGSASRAFTSSGSRAWKASLVGAKTVKGPGVGRKKDGKREKLINQKYDEKRITNQFIKMEKKEKQINFKK